MALEAGATARRSRSPARSAVALESWALSALLSSLIAAWFVSQSTEFQHWFLVPLLLCGTVIGKDAVDWLRGRLGVFDPAGIMGLFGYHFFFVSALLTVWYGTSEFWWAVTPPPDWRDWLGWMAILNLLGLGVYRLTRSLPLVRSRRRTVRSVWRLDRGRFWRIWLMAAPLLGLFLAVLLIKMGGLRAYVAAKTLTFGPGGDKSMRVGAGTGWLATFAERLPIVLWLGVVVHLHDRRKLPGWTAIGLGLAAVFLMQLLIAGPRGSRMAVLLPVLEAITLVHFLVRPVPRKAIIGGAAAMMLLVWVGGFYKAAGLEGLRAVLSSEARARLSEESGRDLARVLTEDLSRAAGQGYILYRVTRPGSDYVYSLGRTYLAALVQPVPHALWPDKPLAKHLEVAQAMFGIRATEEGMLSHRVVGLAGEAILNFSPLAVPLSFAVLGLIVASVRRWVAEWGPDDARLLFAGLLIPLAVKVLAGDSSNLVISLFRYGVTVFPIIYLSARRYRVRIAGPWSGAGRRVIASRSAAQC